MGFLNSYRNKELEFRKTILTKAKVGNDNTLFNKTQTDLISEISSTENTLTQTDIQDGVKLKYVLLEGQGNGETIKEIVYGDGDDWYCREVLPDTTKNNRIQETIETQTFTDLNNE